METSTSTHLKRTYHTRCYTNSKLVYVGYNNTVCVWPEVFDWPTPTSFVIIRPTTNPCPITNLTPLPNPITMLTHPNPTINLTTSSYLMHPTTNQIWLQTYKHLTSQPIHITHLNTKPRAWLIPPTTTCRHHILL